MATWQAIVNGTTYSLSDGNPFKLLGISGIGNAPVRRLEERGPFQDGATDIGYRLDARLINLQIQIMAASLSAADTHRDTLSNIFNPRNGQTIYLRCTRDDGAVRQIDCYSVGMLDMPAELQSRQFGAQRVGVQLKAPNPIWYDPTSTMATFNLAPSEWQTANGLIGSAEIFTYGVNVASGSALPSGTISAGSDYSIVYRTAGSSTIGTYLFDMYAFNSERLLPFMVNGTALFFNLDGEYAAMIPAMAGTQTYMLITEPAGINIYRNGTALAVVPGAGVNGLFSQGFATWGMAGTLGWDTDFSHVAIYRKALNSVERTALLNAIDGVGYPPLYTTATDSGTWDEYPVIYMNGPIDDPIVRNLTTEETLDFTGSTIGVYQTYIIDCRYGYKTVRDTSLVNHINQLSTDSDMATFHLSPGANVISVSSSGTIQPGTVSVSFYNRYLGL